MVTKEQIAQARIARMGENTAAALSRASVGIAGLGGLGSHIAMALARMGVGRLVLADFDRVELTNPPPPAIYPFPYWTVENGGYHRTASGGGSLSAL